MMDWLRRRTWMLSIGKHRSRVIGEEETKGIEDGCGRGWARMNFGWSILIFSLVYFSYVK